MNQKNRAECIVENVFLSIKHVEFFITNQPVYNISNM